MKPETRPFMLTPAQERTRQEQLKRAGQRRRRNYCEWDDVQAAGGPRCELCGLLEPHVCLDSAQVVRT